MGRGTTLKMYLPRIFEASAPRQEDEIVAVHETGNETIQLAEDEASVRELARRVLRDRGYTTISASEALA